MASTSPVTSGVHVEYILDPGVGEVNLGGSASPPYYTQWSINGVSLGSHSLVARAVRITHSTDSTPITVTIGAAVTATLSQKSGVVLYNQFSTNSWNAHPEIKQAILVDQCPKWWRNYVASPEGVANPLPGCGGYFVPMITWPADKGPLQPSSVTPANLAVAVANATGGYISTFTEFEGQGYTVAEACAGWHTMMTDSSIISYRAGGGKIISPYTVQDGSGGGSLFRQFLTCIAGNGDPDADEYALDKYGSSSVDAATNVTAIMTRVNSFHSAFPTKNLWLQEYDVIAGFTQAEDVEQTDFMTLMRAQLDPLSWVTADLWFYGGPKVGVPGFANVRAAALYNDDGTITIAGTKWKQLGR